MSTSQSLLLAYNMEDLSLYLPLASDFDSENLISSTSPIISMTADPKIFNLDMSFNRHPSTLIDSALHFNSDIDPLQKLSPGPRPVPSPLPLCPDVHQYQALFQTWAFPIRTDGPRGLTWGPYAHEPDEEGDAPGLSSPTDNCLSIRSESTISEDEESEVFELSPVKHQRIFPILRVPRHLPPAMRLVMRAAIPGPKKRGRKLSGSGSTRLKRAIDHVVLVSPSLCGSFKKSRQTTFDHHQYDFGQSSRQSDSLYT